MSDVMPLDISAWRMVGPKRGSNPGGVYQDEAGDLWYVKFPQVHAEQANAEVLADTIYAALGIPTKDSCLIVRRDRLGCASPLLDGIPVDPRTVYSQHRAIQHADVLQGCIADAYLAHWDVLGGPPAYRNLLHVGGRMLRIDAGGCMFYRALGRRKPFPADRIDELVSMRLPGMPGRTVWAQLAPGQQRAQAHHLVATLTDALLRALIAEAGFSPGRAQVYFTALRGRRQVLARQFGGRR